MFETKEGEIIDIIFRRDGLTEVLVLIGDEEKKAIVYDDLLGKVEIGDEVLVNTTATSLSLGTGGYDFIISIKNKNSSLRQEGHLMKLRYTPYQIQTFSVEEQSNSNHKYFKEFSSLEGMPVISAPLHSMLIPISVLIKDYNPDIKITYIMTDGGALPIKLSRVVYFLKENNIIDSTITIGHAFGGDLEGVNIYSALIAAKEVLMSDIVIVSMGPGIVGTGTKYGFTGIEQADILHAISILDGDAIAVPRISFSDSRKRHYGISHHSRTVLGELTMIRANIGVPELGDSKKSIIERQMLEYDIIEKHNVIYYKGEQIIDRLKTVDFPIKTMGRGITEEKEYFMTAGIGGILACQHLGGEEYKEIIGRDN